MGVSVDGKYDQKDKVLRGNLRKFFRKIIVTFQSNSHHQLHITAVSDENSKGISL